MSNARSTHKQDPASTGVHSFLCSALACLTALLSGLIALRICAVPEAALTQHDRRWIVDILPSDELAPLKFLRAINNPPTDIGLFGSSRILMIGVDDLAMLGHRMFNFALGGQSVRQSVRLLDELYGTGKASAIAVIAMDHVEPRLSLSN